MARRSKKRPSRHGCVPRLFNLFDFRRSRSNIRLLSDRRPSIREIEGHLSEGNETLALDCVDVFGDKEDLEEKENSMSENGTVSVKELMEVEMITEGDMVSLPQISEMDSCEITASSSERSDLDASSCLSESKTFDKLVCDSIVEQLVGISTESSFKKDFLSILDMLSTQAVTINDQKTVSAVKMLLEQKVLNAKNYEESSFRQAFMDAVKMLASNYGLFMELLQQLNSLRVNQALTCSPASSVHHLKPGNANNDGYSRPRHQKSVRRRSRSLESFLQGENEDYHSSLTVSRSSKTDVSVNEASLLSVYLYNKDKNERCTLFRFSFTGIKRRLWHALGKDKSVFSSEYSSAHHNRKNNGKHKSLGWSSPNRNHFYNERFVLSPGKSREHNLKLKGYGNGALSSPSVGGLNIYIEAKKHIYEMLKDTDEDGDTMIKQFPKSLGMILTVPACSTSTVCIPGVFDDEKLFTSPQNRSGCIIQEDQHSHPTVGEALRGLSSSTSGDADAEVNPVQSESATASQDVEEASKSSLDGGERIMEAYGSRISSTDGDFQNIVGEEQVFSSPAVSVSHSPATSDADGCKLDRPSPISVLDSLFTDDASSPPSIVSDPVRELEPQHLHFEEQSTACDQGVCMRISMEEEESPFEYVEAVLLGSGLDWDDFHLKWLLSSYEILDSSLFSEVELFSNRNDQRLLFDCANEALVGMCDIYFGKENIQPIPVSMDVIDQIWRWIEWHLSRQAQVNSMDRLVQLDLAKSGKWINLQREVMLNGFEIEATILDELMEDAVLSFEENLLENESITTKCPASDEGYRIASGADSS